MSHVYILKLLVSYIHSNTGVFIVIRAVNFSMFRSSLSVMSPEPAKSSNPVKRARATGLGMWELSIFFHLRGHRRSSSLKYGKLPVQSFFHQSILEGFHRGGTMESCFQSMGNYLTGGDIHLSIPLIWISMHYCPMTSCDRMTSSRKLRLRACAIDVSNYCACTCAFLSDHIFTLFRRMAQPKLEVSSSPKHTL